MPYYYMKNNQTTSFSLTSKQLRALDSVVTYRDNACQCACFYTLWMKFSTRNKNLQQMADAKVIQWEYITENSGHWVITDSGLEIYRANADKFF